MANFTVASTVWHKIRTRVVAIDIWCTNLDIVRLLESRGVIMGHSVRRETLQTYEDGTEYLKQLAYQWEGDN